MVAPNLPAKPNTVMFNKVTIKGAKQAVQMFGPAQHAVAKAVADSVADGTIPADEADDLFICVGVFIHWDAADDKKIQDFNYQRRQGIDRARRQRQADGGGSRLSTRLGQAPLQPVSWTVARSRWHEVTRGRDPLSRGLAPREAAVQLRTSMAMRIRSMAERAPSFCLSWVQLLAIVL